MGSAKTPSVPDPAKTYAQGIATNIKYAPEIAAEEYKLRGTYDDVGVKQNLDRATKYGGQALDMYQGYLKDVDPTGQAIRSQLGAAVSSDLAAGTSLTAGQTREDDQAIRAAEVARGNTTGNSAVSAEALNTGNAAQAMYQQRLQNAGTFLAGDNTTQQLTGIAGLTTAATTPDRTDAYVNPQAGVQGQNTALQYYQSALAGGAAGGGNPWTSALASAGGQLAGRYGGQAISGIGSAAYGSYLNATVGSASEWADIAGAADAG